MNIQHITILHSNDIHSDYTHKNRDGSDRASGGIAYLAGYIKQKREAAPLSTIYTFAGDLFNGSLIDTLSSGYDSIRIMNMIKPEVATIGNHELDYQLSKIDYYKDHCEFPLICANIYDKFNEELYFPATHIQPVGNVNILFIGLVTKEIEKHGNKDRMVKFQMEWMDPLKQIVTCYKEETAHTRVDMTVILSHLGLEEDEKLAENLNKLTDVKVDLIIGGHSHSFLQKEKEVGNIRIVQAGTGTAQIGRCEIDFDLDKKTIDAFDWHCDSIVNAQVEPNLKIKKFVEKYEKAINKKYGKTLTTLKKKDDASGQLVPANAEHSNRYKGTEVGNLFCDALAKRFDLDLVLLGSGSLRKEKLYKDVTRVDIMEMYSYEDEKFYAIWLNGAEVKKAMRFFLEKAPLYDPDDDKDYHEEFFQVSWGFYFEYDSSANGDKLVKATYNKVPIKDDDWFRVGIEKFHMNYMLEHLGIDFAKISDREHNGLRNKKKSENIQFTLKEYMRGRDYLEIISEVRVLKK